MNRLAFAVELLPLAVATALVLVLFAGYATRLALVGRARDPRLQREHPTALLGRFPMEAFHWAARGAARALVRLPVHPDHLTHLSLLISALTIPLLWFGAFAWGALVLLVGSTLDALDGIVARERGIASDSGEVLDAVVDRYADAMPLFGLALYYRHSVAALILVFLAILGGFTVSYVRAKAEAMRIELPGGLMRRPERLFYLGIALLFGPALPALRTIPLERPWTLVIVAGIGLLSNVAAIQLTRQTRAALARVGRGPKGTDRAGV
jgi:phosphatidylglycerophosphate synthase